jgi:hypothetical protein
MKIEDLDTYDWKEAFGYASDFKIEDVATIENAVEGENDGDDWIIFGTLKDGRWFSLKAGCDYTGWDCQASGNSHTAATRDELIRMGMDAGTRKRFDLMLPGESL